MHHKFTFLATLAAAGLFACPVFAQNYGGSQMNSGSMGTANTQATTTTTTTETNAAQPQVITTIVSGGAPLSDLDMKAYNAFTDFASQHPRIRHDLNRNPHLVGSSHYLRQHPDFAEFLRSHPDVEEGLRSHPGNYLPIGSVSGQS